MGIYRKEVLLTRQQYPRLRRSGLSICQYSSPPAIVAFAKPGVRRNHLKRKNLHEPAFDIESDFVHFGIRIEGTESIVHSQTKRLVTV